MLEYEITLKLELKYFTYEAMDLKPKTKAEITNEYGICPRTLSRWLSKEKIEVPRGLIKPHQIEKIYKTFGCPEKS